jgi:superfamily II DNA or RNA helicase
MGPRMVPMPKTTIDGVPFNTYIKTIINRLGNTVALEDCFDVPDQIFQTETFSLTKEQKKAIEDNFDTLPIVNFTRQQQICGGTLKSDGYTEDQFFKSEKLDRLLDIISEHEKLIVVCRYNNEIDYIKSKIKNKKVLVIRGDIKDRHSVCLEAETSNNCVVLIQAACSEGYELPSFPIMVFYSYDFSLKNYIQILGRIQRAGKLKKNVYLSLVVKDTVDEAIYKTVAIEKRDFQIELYA